MDSRPWVVSVRGSVEGCLVLDRWDVIVCPVEPLATGPAPSVGGSGAARTCRSLRCPCAFGAQLVSLDPDVTEVAIAATASAVVRNGVNPVVSTAVNSIIRGGSGSVGITSLGSTAAIAGTGSFDRVTTPDLCVKATVSYLDGTTDEAPLRCTPINATVVIDPSDIVKK